MAHAHTTLDVTDLASAAIQHALTLSASLAELRKRHYATSSPQVLLELLTVIVDHVSEELLAFLTERTLVDANWAEVNSLRQVLDSVARYAEYAVRSADVDVPWGLVYPLERFCQQLTRESRILLYPSWERGYGYLELMGSLRNLMKDVRELPSQEPLAGYPRYLAVFSFPPIQGPDILQNAAWGHEIGHHLDRVYQVSERIFPALVFPEAGLGGASTVPGGAADLDSDSMAMAQQRLARLRVARSWMHELVADIFSIHILGPASLFAFATVATTAVRDAPNSTHPPGWLRISAMLDELWYLGYERMLRAAGTPAEGGSAEDDDAADVAATGAAVYRRLKALEALVAGDHPVPVSPPHLAPVITALAGSLAQIVEEVRAVVQPQWACDADTIARDVFHLVARLERAIPPCEVDVPGQMVGRATSLAAIVNAGWFYRIRQGLDAPPASEAEARGKRDGLEQLNVLVLKAVELSAAKRQLDGGRDAAWSAG